MSQSALVIPVPEAEPLIQDLRARHDPSAAAGMAAHITVLYPFRTPEVVGAAVLGELRALFGGFRPIDYGLAGARRFPHTLYLAPEPEAPFRELIQAAAARFPDTRPYGGAFADIIPHVTVGDKLTPDQLEALAAEVERRAGGRWPLPARAESVWLADDSRGRWELRLEFQLGARPVGEAG